MAEQKDLHIVYELFESYVHTIDREFHDDESAHNAYQQCISLASELFEFGFVILAQVNRSMKKITPTDDTIQTIITFTYNMALVKHEIPMQVPIAVASAVAHIFGPITSVIEHTYTGPAISAQDEEWLRKTLDSL